MENKSFQYYIDRYQQGTITAKEWRELKLLVDDPANEKQITEHMDAQLKSLLSVEDEFPIVTQRIVRAIEKKIEAEVAQADPPGRGRVLRATWLRYAAAVILMVGAGTYIWMSQTDSDKFSGTKSVAVKNDVLPGRDGAILTLADGQQITLDSAGSGLLAEQSGTEVLLEDGRLAYNAEKAAAVTYNTMSTPKGRQFSLLLPDGSRAWLNAASSITFPTAFKEKERIVEVTGEVYFEIAADPKKPFLVKLNDNTRIEVLGTSFNVKAYKDDLHISTTLLDGSVRVRAFEGIQTLKPGQQTQVRPDGEMKLVQRVDIDKVMAWKNGLFNFEGMGLKEVMKQLERWYDIEVVYENGAPDVLFFGELDRNVTLSAILDVLKESGIRFRIDDRKLIVTP